MGGACSRNWIRHVPKVLVRKSDGKRVLRERERESWKTIIIIIIIRMGVNFRDLSDTEWISVAVLFWIQWRIFGFCKTKFCVEPEEVLCGTRGFSSRCLPRGMSWLDLPNSLCLSCQDPIQIKRQSKHYVRTDHLITTDRRLKYSLLPLSVAQATTYKAN